tara:strand:- start:5 stop:718 length:714 start_codon:yes stop_codon:yes gene_type:complete
MSKIDGLSDQEYELFSKLRGLTRRNQTRYKSEVEKKQEKHKHFADRVSYEPKRIAIVKMMREKGWSNERIKLMTIDNDIWTEGFVYSHKGGGTYEDGIKNICDEYGVPSVEKMKEQYKNHLRVVKTNLEELEHTKDGEKFWRYSYYFQDEKLGKYHDRQNEYNSDFLSRAIEADLNGTAFGISGALNGRKTLKHYEVCGETIRIMGNSMKAEYDMRENIIKYITTLNMGGIGRQLIE